VRGILRDKAGREWTVTAEKVIDAEEGYVLYDRAVSTELILAEVEVRLCAVVALQRVLWVVTEMTLTKPGRFSRRHDKNDSGTRFQTGRLIFTSFPMTD
jgi:hypothetical protein